MSELSSIYPSTIDRAYYIASFLMRDENLTMDVLKESYSQVGQYAEMLKEGTQAQALVDRIVSAQSLEDLRLKDNVSYQAFYKAEGEDHSFYIDRDKLEPFVPKADAETIGPRGTSYDKAAGRFVTTLKLQPQPQSDAAFLYYYVGMSVKEIAAAMDVSEDVVQGHLHASNVKLMADAENWMKQGRIPAGIDTIPFLVWSLKRDAKRNPYRGVNLLKVLAQTQTDHAADENSTPVCRENDAQRRAERELAGDSRSTGLRKATSEDEPAAGAIENAALEDEDPVIRIPEPVSKRPERAERTSYDRDDLYEEEEEQGRRRNGLPVVPVIIGVLVLAVVVTIAAGLHHRSKVDKIASSSSSVSTVVSENSESKKASSESSASPSSSASSSSSSEEKKTYDDPMDDPDGYIFPNSNKERLSDSDLEGMDKEHLRIARNELYARYGVIFGMQDLNDYFKSKSWYTPKVSINDFSGKEFNQYENYNLKKILEYEKKAQ